MSGRGAGYCAGFGVPGYMNDNIPRLGLGRGWGRGWGRGYGRGWGRGYGWGRGRGYGRGWGRYVWEDAPGPAYFDPTQISPRVVGPIEEDPLAERRFLERLIASLEAQLKAAKAKLARLGEEKEKEKEK